MMVYVGFLVVWPLVFFASKVSVEAAFSVNSAVLRTVGSVPFDTVWGARTLSDVRDVGGTQLWLQESLPRVAETLAENGSNAPVRAVRVSARIPFGSGSLSRVAGANVFAPLIAGRTYICIPTVLFVPWRVPYNTLGRCPRIDYPRITYHRTGYPRS